MARGSGGPRDVVAVLPQLRQFSKKRPGLGVPVIRIASPGKVHQVEKGTARLGVRYTETVNSQCTDVLVYLDLMYRNLIGILALVGMEFIHCILIAIVCIMERKEGV